MERNGFSVAGFDLDKTKLYAFRERAQGKQITIHDALEDFIAHLESSKRILLMVPAGAPVDAVIYDLKPHLSSEDILIDGGNTYFKDTERRM